MNLCKETNVKKGELIRISLSVFVFPKFNLETKVKTKHLRMRISSYKDLKPSVCRLVSVYLQSLVPIVFEF